MMKCLTLIQANKCYIVENVDGYGERRKLGPFALTKQKTVNRSQLIYTVPASRGVPDTTEDEID